MNLNETVINVILDAGRGSVSVKSREARKGAPLGALPTPSRQGYAFGGWYLDGARVDADTVVTSDEDIRLVARWSRQRTAGGKKSSYKKQKIAILVLSLVTVAMIGFLILVNWAVSYYPIEDKWVVDGVEYTETYYVREKNGVYGFYDKDGNLMEINAISTYNMSDGSDTPYVVYIAKKSGNQYLLDTATGTCTPYAVVDYGGDEVLGFRDRILMYPQIAPERVFSIEVKNEHGGFTFYRDQYGNVKLKGFEESTATFDYSQFINLCNACGYTITLQRLDMKPTSDVARLPDGSVDYGAYGLADVYDGEGNLIYTPTVFTIVKADYDEKTKTYSESETRYTVKVGHSILSNTGYYMQLEGRDAIYIGDTVVEETVLQPIEAMMSPVIVYPTTVSNYLMIKNLQLGQIPGQIKDFDPENPEYAGKPIVSFTYQELDERLSTMYTVSPYLSLLDIMDGYTLHDNNVTDMLSLLYQIESKSIVKLGINGETLAEYGLDKNVFYLLYDSPATDGNGTQIGYYSNYLLISQKTKDNTYYVASFVSDMILEVDAAYLAFLGWDESDWYHEYFFQHNVANVPKLDIQIGDQIFNFTLDNSLSYGYYENANGTMTRISLERGSVHQKSDGGWVYTDASGVAHNVRVFDFSKGDLYFKIVNNETKSVEYREYYKYLLTKDRNGDWELHVVERNADGVEVTWPYDLGASSSEKFSYRLVYVDGNGEEFDVAGAYTDGNGQRFSSPYVLTYWQEVKTTTPSGQTTYVWERKVTNNAATSIMLRTTKEENESDRKTYQVPVLGNNLQVSCQQGSLDYTAVYQYKTDMGTVETATLTGADNFRDLYSRLLYYSLEGTINRTEFEAQWGMSVESYIAGKNPNAIFSYTVSDMSANMNIITSTDAHETDRKPTVAENGEEKIWHEDTVKNVVVRLYQYSPTRSILTMSVNGSEETAVFYVQSSYCDEILDAAQKLIAQIPIDPLGEIVK